MGTDVDMAKEFMDQGPVGFRAASQKNPARDDGSEPDAATTSGAPTKVSAQVSSGLESNPDSCYDSDASSAGSQGHGLPTADVEEHSDVSRTTSDTLAAESSETDLPSSETPRRNDVAPGERSVGAPDPHSETMPASWSQPMDLMSNVEYATKVEFGLRLGYSEDQILAALNKVGYKVSEDELLSELIKIGNMTEDSDEDDSSSSDLNTKLDRIQIDEGENDPDELRPIIIDGSNVAMSHGNNAVFSCVGIKLAVDWFRQRGHKEIKVFTPMWRKETSCPVAPITGQDILLELEKENVMVFTPARRIGGKRVVCYDDRYIIKVAAENGGIVVSNDNYRDLIDENADYKKVIEERLLMYSFVNDRFMPPDDPLGRNGPSLDDFLRKHPRSSKNHPSTCPYGKKCTYGNKCKYYHPERGQQPLKLVNEKLIEKACKKIREVKEKGHLGSGKQKIKQSAEKPTKKLPLTLTKSQPSTAPKKALTRTKSLQPNQSGSQLKPRTIADFMKWPSEATRSGAEPRSTGARVSGITESDEEDSQKHKKLVKQWRGEASMGLSRPEQKQDDSREKKQLSSWAIPQNNLFPPYVESETSFTNGHLALAKKLSDEGNSCESRQHTPVSYAVSPIKAQASNNQQSVQGHEQKVPGHRTLQRQLSLKGSDDPRLVRGPCALQFDGMFASQRDDKQHWSRQGHSLLTKRASCPVSSGQVPSRDGLARPQPPPADLMGQPAPSLDYHGHVHDNNMTVVHHENSLGCRLAPSGHLPIHRLKSDPLVHPNDAQTHKLWAKYAEISRQNSTSDPQLSSHQEEQLSDAKIHQSMLGIPENRGTIPSLHHAQMSQYGHGTFAGGQSTMPMKLAQSQGSVPNAYSNHGVVHLAKCSASNLHPGAIADTLPASYNSTELMSTEINRNSGFLVQKSEPPSLLLPGMVHDMSTPPPSLTPVASYQTSSVQASFHQHPSQMLAGVQPHTVAPVSLQVPVFFQDPTVQSSVSVASTKTGEPQSCWPSHATNQADPRQKLYFHLCALFKEEDVRRVMNEHPSETNAQILCKYLIDL